jgi:hypothetical protein
MRVDGSSLLIECGRGCTGLTSSIEILLAAKFLPRNLSNS